MTTDAERYARRKATITPATAGERVCTSCLERKAVTEFGVHPLGRDGRAPVCKSCESVRMQRHRHGLTRADKDRIATEQGGCLICRRVSPGGKGWVVDHDHSCCPGEKSCEKCRRGVLCQWCNNVLGYALDSTVILRAAADYLDSHQRSLERAV